MLVLLVLVFILIAPMILLNLVRNFFGMGKTNSKQNTSQQDRSGTNNSANTNRNSNTNRRQRNTKIFEKNEGEYVDFTEVKE